MESMNCSNVVRSMMGLKVIDYGKSIVIERMRATMEGTNR